MRDRKRLMRDVFGAGRRAAADSVVVKLVAQHPNKAPVEQNTNERLASFCLIAHLVYLLLP